MSDQDSIREQKVPLSKPKRYVDKKLLKEIKKWPCLACKTLDLSDPAHIHSVGAGGPDHLWNVIPLCRYDHQLQHSLGWEVFLRRWPLVWIYLQTLGWYWLNEKLWNDKLNKY